MNLVIQHPRPRNLREPDRLSVLSATTADSYRTSPRSLLPFTNLTKKGVPFSWEGPQEQAFENLKSMLASAPVLAHYDPSLETILQTDASHFGWGFFVSQINAETRREHPDRYRVWEIYRFSNQLFDERKGYDILQGLHEDNEIAPVRQEMMQIRFTNCQHLTCAPSRLNVPSLNELRRRSRNQQLTSPTWTKRGFLALEGRFYVPNYNDARLKVLRARHDSPLAGHPGISKTIELISRDYTWVGLKKDVEAYVFGCAVCQRTKPSHQRPSGHLRSLEVPTQPWADISMDLSRNYQGRTNITRYSLLSINKRSGRSSYLP